MERLAHRKFRWLEVVAMMPATTLPQFEIAMAGILMALRQRVRSRMPLSLAAKMPRRRETKKNRAPAATSPSLSHFCA
jgi:hypothetical protein